MACLSQRDAYALYHDTFSVAVGLVEIVIALPTATPNNGVQLTGNSVRSSLAPASSRR